MKKENKSEENKEYVACLKNEIVTARYIPRVKGNVTNPKHVFYGGMAEGSAKWFTVPKSLESGTYVRVLTDEEQDYLEYIMGLEPGDLSVFRTEKNFWENKHVRLTKGDNHFDLSTPMGYINYKILLSNPDQIAPSLQVQKDRPKITHQYVLVNEQDEIKMANKDMSESQEAWMNFGKISDSFDTMKYVVEIVNGKVLSSDSKIEFIRAELNKIIKSNPKLLNDIVSDPHLDAKVLITKAVTAGVLKRRGDLYYDGASPLSNGEDEPTLSVAAKYINHPKNQTVKLSIEAKLK